jgi:hypothetical protein
MKLFHVCCTWIKKKALLSISLSDTLSLAGLAMPADKKPKTPRKGSEKAEKGEKQKGEKQPKTPRGGKEKEKAKETAKEKEKETAPAGAAAQDAAPPSASSRSSSKQKKPPMKSALTEGEQRFVHNTLAPFVGESPLFSSWVEIAVPNESKSHSQPLNKLKWAKKIFVVGLFRFFVISKSALGGRKSVDHSPHFYDVAALGGMSEETNAGTPKGKSTKKNPAVSGRSVLRITVNTSSGAAEDGPSTTSDAKQKTFFVKSAEYVDDILHAVRNSYARISAHFGDRDFIHPFSMIANVPQDVVRPHDVPPEDLVGTAALNNTYVAMCNYRGERVGVGFPRFVEELMRRGTRVMQLNHCPGIEQHSEVALATGAVLQALNFNPEFRALIIRRVTLDKGPGLEPGLCVRYNNCLTKLVLTGIDGAVDWVNFGRALIKNAENQIQILDVSDNALSQKDVASIGKAIESFTHALPVLRMNNCRLKDRQIEEIMRSLKEKFEVSLTLRELSLCDNDFGEGGTAALANWLYYAREFSQLRRLLVANSNVSVGMLDEANIGVLLGLELLDISGNNCTAANAIGVVETAVSNTSSCARLRVARSRGLDGPGLSRVMSAALGNTSLHDIELDFSGNTALGKDGASIAAAISSPLFEFADKMYSLRALDFSNCRLGATGIGALLQTLGENCMTLAELSIGGNVAESGGGRDRIQECESFCGALVSFFAGGTGVSRLSIATRGEARVGPALEEFFRYLADDQGLEDVDFSGNRCGDRAFLALTESLYVNSKIHTMKIDRNSLGYNAYLALRQVMEHNFVLRDIEHPAVDLAAIREKYRRTPRILELRDTVFAFESKLAANRTQFNLVNVSEDDFEDVPYDSDDDGDQDGDVDPALKLMRLYASWWPKAADRDDAEPPAKAAPMDELPPHLVGGIPAPVVGANQKRKPTKSQDAGDYVADEAGEAAPEKKPKQKDGKKGSSKKKDAKKEKPEKGRTSGDKKGKKAGKGGKGDKGGGDGQKEPSEGDVDVDVDVDVDETPADDAEGAPAEETAGIADSGEEDDNRESGASGSESESEEASQDDDNKATETEVEKRARELAEREAALAEKERVLQEKQERRATMRDIRKAKRVAEKKKAQRKSADPVDGDSSPPPPTRAAPTLPDRLPPAALPDSASDSDADPVPPTSLTADLDDLAGYADGVSVSSPATHLRQTAAAILESESESDDGELPEMEPSDSEGAASSDSYHSLSE